jgi:putative membrane protein
VIAIGGALAGIAAAVHVYIFVLESLIWNGDRARAVFGTTREEAATTRVLAFNQGFYNLFLAVATLLGIVLLGAGRTAVGATLVLTGAGSMVAAGLVLLVSSPTKARAALVQLGPPALGVTALVVGLAR